MPRTTLKHLCLFCGERKITEEVACYFCRIEKRLRYIPKHRVCEECWQLTIKAGGHLPFYKKPKEDKLLI